MDELLRGHYYHLYTKKQDGRVLFVDRNDYFFFIHAAARLKRHHNMELTAYCLLPDHYHFIIGADMHEAPGTMKGNNDMHPLVTFMRSLHHEYNRQVSAKHHTHPGLHDPDLEIYLIDNSEHLKTLTCYLHYHPERSALVKDSKEWPHSSLGIFLDNFETDEHRLLDRRFFYERDEYERFFKDYLFDKDEKDRMIASFLHPADRDKLTRPVFQTEQTLGFSFTPKNRVEGNTPNGTPSERTAISRQ